MRQLWEHCEAGAGCSPASTPQEPAGLQQAKRGWGLGPNAQVGLLEHGRDLLSQKMPTLPRLFHLPRPQGVCTPQDYVQNDPNRLTLISPKVHNPQKRKPARRGLS